MMTPVDIRNLDDLLREAELAQSGLPPARSSVLRFRRRCREQGPDYRLAVYARMHGVYAKRTLDRVIDGVAAIAKLAEMSF